MRRDPKPVLFVFSTAYHPFIGGAEIAVEETAKRLADQFRFFIVTARLRRDLPGREERPEGTVIRVGAGLPFDKWLLMLLGPCAVFRELSRLRTRRALLWGVDISAGSLAAAILKSIRGLPFILSVQYGYGDERLRRGRIGLIGRGYRFLLRRADAVTAISSFLAGTAKHFGYRGSVRIIPNGVALERFGAVPQPPRPRPPVVITVSRLVPKNGVATLIRAVLEVRRSVPDVRCHILGDGPERPSLEALTRALGLTTQITFFGAIPYAELPRYLAEADVFVRPSRSEGLGNAFVEALAAGLPIVGTPVEGILDIIHDGKTGLFCRVDDAADVAEKIVRLLGDRPFAERLAANGRRMVEERFSWATIAAAYGHLFNQVLQLQVLIAAPMYPPDIGGPGTYAKHLAGELARRRHGVWVLSYQSRRPRLPGGDIRHVSIPLSAPLFIRHAWYAWAAWRLLGSCDIAVALDPVAVGRPLAIACRLRAKPFLLRVEGDSPWERYVGRTGDEITLRQFYEGSCRHPLSRRERAWQRISRWVFPRAARIVFSSRWREEIFRLGYPLRREQPVLIAPSWPRPGRGGGERDRTVVFAGRFVRVKNLRRLVRAFAAVSASGWRLELIGDGPDRPAIEAEIIRSGAGDRIRILPAMASEDLRRRIASAHAFALPSLSDASPNVILDCIAEGTPFLLTRETGFHEALKDVGLFVDPTDEREIAAKLGLLFDLDAYAAYRERLTAFGQARGWDQVADEWLTVVQSAS